MPVTAVERKTGQSASSSGTPGCNSLGLDPKGRRSGGPSSRIFDNKVEHASREITIRFGLIISQGKASSSSEHGRGHADSDLRRIGEASGFKREFDPGSESTLAACLTHASRTRKGSNT
jgi:hypothetical protein